MKTLTRTLAASSLFVLMAGTAVWAAAPAFSENWNASSSEYFNFNSSGRNTATSNVADPAATDGKVMQLQLGARPRSGPRNGIGIESKSDEFQYGTYRARLKTADCSAQPNAGVVSAFFTFFNDGTTDLNRNGLPDNSEIDFEWLCAKPEEIHLTMWTDYRDSDEEHRRMERIVNLRTGTILRTCFFERFGPGTCQALSGNEAQPTAVPAIADYAPHKNYYEYGFTWTANRVAWWIVNPANGQRIVLWDYQGLASRIPATPAFYLSNLWHTSNWFPDGLNNATQKPRRNVLQFIDWMAFDPNPRF